MSKVSWYYLHENGDLICKSDYEEIIADFQESDFVKHFWMFDPTSRLVGWSVLVEALALSANEERVSELAEKWGCNDEDADEYTNRIGVETFLDGDSWCAVGPGFINLAESPAGFGHTKLSAISSLCKDMGFRAQKTGGESFKGIIERYGA